MPSTSQPRALAIPPTTTPAPALPFAQALLTRAFSPPTALTHYTDRLKRPLHIRATSPPPSARSTRRKALNARRAASKKHSANNTPRPLSAASRRKLDLTRIPEAQRSYALYEPLHALWLGYVRDILGVGGDADADADADARRGVYVTPSSAGQVLASADMHGALLRVVRSRCVSRVGLEGIVVRDTRYTFELVTRGGGIKAVPKEHTVFGLEIEMLNGGRALRFEILGEQFQSRAPDRANRKFRLHYQPFL